VSSLDLRPLSLGEILDRTFTLYRRHFLLFLGSSAIPRLPLLALQVTQAVLVVGARTGAVGGNASGVPAWAAAHSDALAGVVIVVAILVLIFTMIAYLLAQGATVFSVSELYLGHTITIRQSFSRMRGNMLSLLGVLILNGLAVGAATLLLIIPGIWLACRLLVVVPVALLEGEGPRGSLSRSMRLTEDHAGNAFLILLLSYAITFAAAMVFAVPFQLAQFFDTIRHTGSPEIWAALTQVGTSISTILVVPILTIASSIFYFDLRVRKEGLDLQMMLRDEQPQGTLPGGVPTMLT